MGGWYHSTPEANANRTSPLIGDLASRRRRSKRNGHLRSKRPPRTGARRSNWRSADQHRQQSAGPFKRKSAHRRFRFWRNHVDGNARPAKLLDTFLYGNTSNNSTVAQDLTAAVPLLTAASKAMASATGPYAIPGTSYIYNPATGQILFGGAPIGTYNPATGALSVASSGLMSYLPILLGLGALFFVVSALKGKADELPPACASEISGIRSRSPTRTPNRENPWGNAASAARRDAAMEKHPGERLRSQAVAPLRGPQRNGRFTPNYAGGKS